MPIGTKVMINTIKPEADREKYGRFLMTVTLPDGSDLDTAMITAGQGVLYEGGARESAIKTQFICEVARGLVRRAERQVGGGGADRPDLRYVGLAA